MSTELRITDTNSAEDSGGLVWGIEGNLFWWIVGGAFASVMTLLVLFSIWRLSFAVALASALAPMAVVLVYIFLFKQNKPPYYDVDCLGQLAGRAGFWQQAFSPDPRNQPEFPYQKP